MSEYSSPKGQEKLPEPRKEPCENERVVNRPYEKPSRSEKNLKDLSKEIGK